MTHLAYNLTTGEVLTTNHGNHLKRWVARHTANDRKWAKRYGVALPHYRWVFAHGGDYNECVAKLTIRKTWG
jgi:hypothetical protein